MRRSSIAFAIPTMMVAVVLAGLSAVGGDRGAEDESDVATAPLATRSASAPTAEEAATLRRAPAARLFVGTQSAEGRVVRFCRNDRCVEDPRARPRADLATADGGAAFLMFTLRQAPAEARVETIVRGARSGTPAVSALSPGTTMLWRDPPRAPGRYSVTLVARWRDAECRWVFGIVLPA